MPKTISPIDGKVLQTYEYISDEQLKQKIDLAQQAFESWHQTSLQQRKELFLKLAQLMMEQQQELAKLNTLEMGMVFKTALGDVKKSAQGTIYFAEHAQERLKPIEFDEGGLRWKRVFEPLGIIYTISPWNYPYNQVLRNAVPNILAGNVVLSKHASNVPQVANKIEELFLQAGFPKWVYQNLQISASKSEMILADFRVRWTNITWWDKAGRVIGSLAGKYIKPSILELGGSDPFLVLEVADWDEVIKLAIKWRFSNAGQKCNSSKRFIVLERYYDEFVDRFAQAIKALKVGNPFDDVDIGPLAKLDLVEQLEAMVKDAVAKWARLLVGGQRLDREGFYFAPTLLADVVPWMQVFDEETFGPVAPVIKARDIEEAIQLANNSRYGLASTVVSQSKEIFDQVASQLQTGNVFWNQIPTSYPFLPYGGIKDSGYGKELGERWMKNFTNEKIVVEG